MNRQWLVNWSYFQDAKTKASPSISSIVLKHPSRRSKVPWQAKKPSSFSALIIAKHRRSVLQPRFSVANKLVWTCSGNSNGLLPIIWLLSNSNGIIFCKKSRSSITIKHKFLLFIIIFIAYSCFLKPSSKSIKRVAKCTGIPWQKRSNQDHCTQTTAFGIRIKLSTRSFHSWLSNNWKTCWKAFWTVIAKAAFYQNGYHLMSGGWCPGRWSMPWSLMPQ